MASYKSADHRSPGSARSRVTEPFIPDLLKLAGVPPTDKKAATWIKDALKGAQSSFNAGQQRPHPPELNDVLDDIGRSAKQLLRALERLRRRETAWRLFWHSGAFGRVLLDRVELEGVVPALKNMPRAAEATKIRRQGRPPAVAKQHVVDLAFSFFVRFSPKKISGTRTGAFAKFARAFYAAAIGADPDQHGGLDRQIRQVQKRLPVEHQRAQQKSGKKTRVSS